MLLEQLTAIIGLDVTGSCVQVHVNQPCSFCTEGIQLDDFLWIAWIGSLRSVVRNAEKTVRSIRYEYKGNRLTHLMLDYIKSKGRGATSTDATTLRVCQKFEKISDLHVRGDA